MKNIAKAVELVGEVRYFDVCIFGGHSVEGSEDVVEEYEVAS